MTKIALPPMLARLAAAAALVAGGCGTAAASALTIAAGPANGGYLRMAEDIARLAADAGLDVVAKESPGSLTNAYAIRFTPGVQLGMAQSDVIDYIASRAAAPDQPPETAAKARDLADSLALVAALHREEVHILARGDIDSLADLAGKRVAMGQNGSGSVITAERLLNLAGVTVEPVSNLAPADALDLLRVGYIDAMVYVVGQPAPLFAQGVTAADGLRFVPVDDPAATAAYPPAEIRADSYPWLTGDVPTVSVQAVLVGYPYRHAGACDAIGRLRAALDAGISTLAASGHATWRDVDLGAPVAAFPAHPCVQAAARRLAPDAPPAPPAAPERTQPTPVTTPPAGGLGVLDSLRR